MMGGHVPHGLGVKEKKEKQVMVNVNDDDKIHIFSLATGHLYER
jgi:hypothetical protein